MTIPVACKHTRGFPTDAAHESSQDLQQALSFRRACIAVRVLLMKVVTMYPALSHSYCERDY